jgi:hypothetical protein
MKAEFDLNVSTKTGGPIITFKHHDKDSSLEQQILKVFIDGAIKNGIELVPTNGFLEVGTNNSFEQYEIRIKKR